MRFCLTAVLLALTSASLIAPSALAQEDRLPDLTPREFEIRGDLQISLPTLERQPLRGFAPPPRTYVVPADRQAYVGPYAQRMEDLPEDPIAAPAAPSIARAVPRYGQIDLMAGRYLGRRGRFTFNAGPVGLDLAYAGHSGFSPAGASPDAHFAADAFNGRLSLAGGDTHRYTASLDGAHHTYGLMGAYGAAEGSSRELRVLGLAGGLESASPQLPVTLQARFETNRVSDLTLGTVLRPGPDDDRQQEEARLAMAGTFDAGTLRLEAGVTLSGLDAEGLGTSLTTYTTGGAVALSRGPLRLSLGARLFGYDSSPANGSGSSFQVGPLVEAELAPSPAFRLYAWNRAELEARSLADIFHANPYASPTPFLAPDLHPINAEGGLELNLSVVRLNLYAGARYSPSLLYFEHPDALSRPIESDDPGLYRVVYDEAALVRSGGDVTLYGPGNVSLSAGGEFRASRLIEQHRAIPFVAPAVGRVSLAVPFAQARGLLQATYYAEVSRPHNLGDPEAPAWSDLTVEAHYRFAGRFGVIARADHLAGRAEQWPGFPRPPAMITAGLRAGW